MVIPPALAPSAPTDLADDPSSAGTDVSGHPIASGNTKSPIRRSRRSISRKRRRWARAYRRPADPAAGRRRDRAQRLGRPTTRRQSRATKFASRISSRKARMAKLRERSATFKLKAIVGTRRRSRRSRPHARRARASPTNCRWPIGTPPSRSTRNASGQDEKYWDDTSRHAQGLCFAGRRAAIVVQPLRHPLHPPGSPAKKLTAENWRPAWRARPDRHGLRILDRSSDRAWQASQARRPSTRCSWASAFSSLRRP